MYVAVKGGTAVRHVLASNRRLVVPEYQRDYAWGIKEGGQLLNDLLEHLDGQVDATEPDPYFLGTIILTVVDDIAKAENETTVEIVDGQQRLVTLTILLACLRDLESDPAIKAEIAACLTAGGGNGAAPKPLLTLRQDDDDFFFRTVQAPDATTTAFASPIGDETRRNISAVRNLFRTELGRLVEENRQIVAKFVANYCLVAVVTARSREESYRIFTRVNQRGKALRRSDILKAQIIGAIAPAERRERIAAWDEYKNLLGDEFDGEAKRRYLFSYISGFHASDGNIIDNVLAMARAKGAAAFMDEVFVPVAQAYHAVLNAKVRYGTPDERHAIEACLQRLRWLPNQDWVGLVIQLMRAFAGHPTDLIRHLAEVERFAYGQVLLQANQYKVKVRRRDPFTEAARLVISSTGDVDLSPALARTPAEIKILAKALAAIPVRRQGKALLVRLFYDIDGGDMALCDAMMRSDDYEIEHMVPIRPQGDSDWSRIHGAAVGQVARRTGNLFVIPRGLNDALANSDWGHKRRVLARHPDAVVAPLGNHVRNAELWDAQAIEARQALLVEAGHRLWVENAPTTAAKPANAKAKTVHTNKASGRATRKPKRKGVRAPFLKAR